MADLVTALGLALVLEGVFYALFTDHARKMMAYLLTEESGFLRRAGLMAMVLGVVVVAIGRKLS